MKFLDYFKKKTNKNEKENKKVILSDIASISPENPINNQNKVRVIYCNTETIETGYDSFKKLALDLTIGNPLLLPSEMSLEDSYLIISKLLDDNRSNADENINQFVEHLAHDLFDYGFSEIKTTLASSAHLALPIPGSFKTAHINECPEIEGVKDLIISEGDLSLFRKTDIASRQTEWYTPGITQEQIDQFNAKRKADKTLSQDK